MWSTKMVNTETNDSIIGASCVIHSRPEPSIWGRTQFTFYMASAGVLTQQCNTRGSARPLKHALLCFLVSYNEGQGCVGSATCELSADSTWDTHLNAVYRLMHGFSLHLLLFLQLTVFITAVQKSRRLPVVQCLCQHISVFCEYGLIILKSGIMARLNYRVLRYSMRKPKWDIDWYTVWGPCQCEATNVLTQR
jgi:hypothetical protein